MIKYKSKFEESSTIEKGYKELSLEELHDQKETWMDYYSEMKDKNNTVLMQVAMEHINTIIKIMRNKR